MLVAESSSGPRKEVLRSIFDFRQFTVSVATHLVDDQTEMASYEGEEPEEVRCS